MAKDFESLKQQALVIKNEVEDGANNTERVGGMLEDIVESMKLGTCEFNVSSFYPTSGISGGNKYTLETAIAQVPAEYRVQGVKITFINENNDTESWEYKGTTWVVGGFSEVGSGKFSEVENEIIVANLNASCKIYIAENKYILEESNFFSGDVGSLITYNKSNYNSFKPIPCKKGDIFILSTIGGANGRAYYITDENNIILDSDEESKNYIDNPKELKVTQDNAAMLYVNCIISISSAKANYEKSYIQKKEVELQKKLDIINDKIVQVENDTQEKLDIINDRIENLENDTQENTPIYAKDGGDKVKVGNFFSGEVGEKIIFNGSAYNSFNPISCKIGDIIEICTKCGQNGVAYYVTDAEQTVLSMDSKGTDYLDAPLKLEITDENAALLFINIIVLSTSTENYNKVYYKQYSAFSQLKDRIENLENGIGNKITDATTEYFKVKVTGKPWLSDNNFISQSSDTLINSTEYNDNCIYCQPQCKDNPVKLVIYCHGGSQYVGGNSSEGFVTGYPLNILQKLGYAYLCCNCYPYDYMHGVLGIGTGALADSAPVGNWTIMQAYSKALNYVLNKYNIDKDNIFLMGVSQGGMTAENIAELMDINFKAECILEPAISMQFVQPNIRANYLQAMYGFSTPETFSLDKVHGLDPFSRNTDSETGLNKNSSFEDCIAITTKKGTIKYFV